MGDTLASLDKGNVKVDVTSNITRNTPETNDFIPEGSIEKTPEVGSEDSIVCIDEDEEFRLPALPPELSTIAQLSENASNNINEDDEDFSIVYEKISPPSEVQIVINAAEVSKSKNNKKGKRQRNMHLAEHRNSGSVTVSEQINSDSPVNNILDDSVCIVGEYEAPRLNSSAQVRPTTPTVEVSSSLTNNVHLILAQRPAPDSVERKKRKIECGVCFDGPDEITLSGNTVISTVCGHIFCNNCIKMAIKNTKQCPQCRKRLNSKQYHPIYI